MSGHLECVSWEFRQPNTHSELINEPLADEIMDFPDIIYWNNNYVESLHDTGNNDNINIIFTQQFYIPKQLETNSFLETVFCPLFLRGWDCSSFNLLCVDGSATLTLCGVRDTDLVEHLLPKALQQICFKVYLEVVLLSARAGR